MENLKKEKFSPSSKFTGISPRGPGTMGTKGGTEMKYKLFALVLLAAPGLLWLWARPAQCLVTDGGRTVLYRGQETRAEEILADLGLDLGPGDRWAELTTGASRYIRVQRLQRLTLRRGGQALSLESYGETVGALLRRYGVVLQPCERLCCDAALPTFDGMEIRVTAAQCRVQTETVLTPPRTVLYYTDCLAPGEQTELSPGSPGQSRSARAVVYENGRQTGSILLPGSEICPARDRVVLRGVDLGLRVHLREGDPPRLHTLGGKALEYRRVLHVLATAYTCPEGEGVTALGTRARVGVVAVDPQLIPYGTRLYIVSDDGAYVYGFAVAEDCGSFRGSRVDLYFNTLQECWDFGVRACTVYVL